MNEYFKIGFEKVAISLAIGPAAAKIEAFRAARKAAKGLVSKADDVLNYKTLRKEFSQKSQALRRAPKAVEGYSAHFDTATKGMNSGTNYRKVGISTNVDPRAKFNNAKARSLF